MMALVATSRVTVWVVDARVGMGAVGGMVVSSRTRATVALGQPPFALKLGLRHKTDLRPWGERVGPVGGPSLAPERERNRMASRTLRAAMIG